MSRCRTTVQQSSPTVAQRSAENKPITLSTCFTVLILIKPQVSISEPQGHELLYMQTNAHTKEDKGVSFAGQ